MCNNTTPNFPPPHRSVLYIIISSPIQLKIFEFYSISTRYYNRTIPAFSVCIGTNGRLSVPSNRDHHYRNLRDRYTNCTYVDGNLELTWLQDEHLDLSFLQHIREVTGYVLITHVDVSKIVLPRLQIIRGRTQFKLAVKEEEFSLLVMLSKMNNLELPALRGKKLF